jgi:hypothetical protein
VPGPYTLSISALGHTAGSSDIVIAGDTTLAIELDRAPPEPSPPVPEQCASRGAPFAGR